jgi:hypothetical protein
MRFLTRATWCGTSSVKKCASRWRSLPITSNSPNFGKITTAAELNAAGGAMVIYPKNKVLVEMFKTIRKGKSWKGEIKNQKLKVTNW